MSRTRIWLDVPYSEKDDALLLAIHRQIEVGARANAHHLGYLPDCVLQRAALRTVSAHVDSSAEFRKPRRLLLRDVRDDDGCVIEFDDVIRVGRSPADLCRRGFVGRGVALLFTLS